MSWQAPNLLDRIFAKPEVADSNVIGNFMGGYTAGKKIAGENAAAKSFNEGAAGNNAALDALGKAGLISSDAASATIPAMPEKGWAQSWMQGTMEGKAAAGNWLQYRQAQTADKISQSHLQLASADLAIKQNTLTTQADTRQGEAALSEAMATMTKNGSWTNPESRAAIYKVAEQYPGVAASKMWAGIQAQFTAADKAKVAADKYQNEATHQAEIAKAKEMELQKINTAGKVLETTGVNSFTVDENGNSTVDLDLAGKGVQVGQAEKRAQEIARIEAQGRNQVANTEARGKITLKEAEMKLADKKDKPSTFFKDHAAMAAYNGRQHSIKTDTKLSAIQKLQMLDKLDTEYGIHGAQVDDPYAEKPAKAPPMPTSDIVIQNGVKFKRDSNGGYSPID